MNKATIYKFVISGLTLLAPGCNPLQIDQIQDPNNPSVGSVLINATKPQIQYLVTGLESRHRNYVELVTQSWGSLGREVWILATSDTRYMTEWLGLNNFQLNANVFLFGTTGAGSYGVPYQAIKQAYVLQDAAANTSQLSVEEKHGVSGFAKTIAAYQFMIPANWLYDNGVRIDVKDETNPGPFVPYQAALDHIKGLIDEGYADLETAGSTVFYSLSEGFDGFDTPEGLAKVNRAIAARLAVYRRDWAGALAALDQSFMDPQGELDAGPEHTFSGGADLENPLYSAWDVPNPGLLRVVTPSTLRDTTAGDRRVRDKFLRRTTPFSVSTSTTTLTGTYQDRRYPTNTAPVPFIRNEELILIKAEAEAQLDHADAAVEAINVVRQAAGIGDYDGPTDKNSLLHEILYQRRYSLWAEPWGHRWIDVRRYTGQGLLFASMEEAIDKSFDNGAVFRQFPLPQAEVNWEQYQQGR